MASLRKKLSMALGLNSEASSSASKASSGRRRKTSIDSGYHSMIAKPECGNPDSDSQAATFVTSGTEGSPDHSPDDSPKKPRKTISSTFSGAMQAFSNTVRATTSYIYPTTSKPELPSSEWLECATPRKESSQSSVISSLRSRKQRFTPRAIEYPETQTSPVPVTRDESPALDVKIPNPSLDYEHLGKFYISNGAQLLAGVKLPPGPKNLWPGPTRLRSPPNPYVKQKDGLQNDPFITSPSKLDLDHSSTESNKRYMSDDKGYLSEAESNAEISEADDISPIDLEHVALGLPEAGTSLPSHDKKPAASHIQGTSLNSPHEKTFLSMPSTPLGSELSKPEHLDGTAEQMISLEPPNRRFSRQNSSLEDGLNSFSPKHRPAISSKSKSLSRHPPFDGYDADVENSESSMGSRAVWECIRADRDRRYEQIFHTAPDTESDKESSPELELKRSPSRKPVHYAEGPVQSKADLESSQPALVYPASDLRYAIEAIERQTFPIEDAACAIEAAEKPALPTGDLAYAVEAIDRPSITTFEPLETIYQQRPMLRLSDTVDEPRKLPQTLESTVTTRRLTDEEHINLGAEIVKGKSIRQRSSGPSDISANASPKNQSHTAPENGYETGIEAGSPSIPASVSSSSLVRDDACLAGLRAVGASEPVYSLDGVNTGPVGFSDHLEPFDCRYREHPGEDSCDNDNIHSVFHSPPIHKEISHSTYREKPEAESPFPKQETLNGIHFQHRRTVSGWTSNTDDSGATTMDSPSSKAPPPFPNLLVQSEPARGIPNAFDALASHGHDKMSSSGPANASIIPSLPSSPLDYPDKQINEAGLKSFPPIASEGASSPEKCAQMTPLEQYDLQGRSSSTASSTQTRSNSNTRQRTFNAAKLPSFGSPCPMASKKPRRKQRKSSRRTTNSKSRASEPDFSIPKLESNKNSASGKMPTSRCGSPRLAGGSAKKRSPKYSIGQKYQSSRDQGSAKELADLIGDLVRWSHSTSKSTSSNEKTCEERENPAILTTSPPRMKLPRNTGAMSFEGFCDRAENAINTPEFRHQPKLPSINNSNSMDNGFSLQVSEGVDGLSCTSHESDSVVQEKYPGYSYQNPNHGLQQEGDGKAECCVGGDETIGRARELHKDASRIPQPKKNSKPPPEAAKVLSVQRELDKRSDRPCSRLAGKLKNGTLADVHGHELSPTHKDGRPPWRP